MVYIKVINKSNYDLPKHTTESSAGVDLRANIDKSILLRPGKRLLVPTGLYIELPLGYEAQIRPRSGLALKHGITVLNTPGTIDADYRGEIGVILINLSDENFTINPGERIAQMVVTNYESIKWLDASSLSRTERGEKGIGHSGVK